MAASQRELCEAAHEGAADAEDVDVHGDNRATRLTGVLPPLAKKARNCNAPRHFSLPLDLAATMSAIHNTLRTELAVTAARLITEEGCDYGQAKRRAVQALLGSDADTRGVLPDNAEIEQEVRRHLNLFAADTHPALLAGLRRTAAAVMERLQDFKPHLVGAVLGGTATEHSDIELHLFSDSAKDVEVALMNAGIDFEVDAGNPDVRPSPQEVLLFTVAAGEPGLPASLRRVGVRLHVFDHDAIRVAPRHRAAPTGEFELHPVAASGRASLPALIRLISESAP
jgi:hypothetical protein